MFFSLKTTRCYPEGPTFVALGVEPARIPEGASDQAQESAPSLAFPRSHHVTGHAHPTHKTFTDNK